MPNEITSLIFIECVRDIKAISIVANTGGRLLSPYHHYGEVFGIPRARMVPPLHVLLSSFDLCLERSQSRLLDLGFNFRRVRVEGYLSILKAALPYVARWRHLTILASVYLHKLTTNFLLSHPQMLSAPHLQYLALSLDNENYNDLTSKPLPKLFKGGTSKSTFLQMDPNTWPNCPLPS